MVKFDTTILLRAIAIFAIVSSHFGLLNSAGGAYVLIALSGFNFVKFTFPKLDFFGKTHQLSVFNPCFIKHYFDFVLRIIIPTCLYLLLLSTVYDNVDYSSLFLISNFYGPSSNGGFSYWFIEVLIQIYFIFGLIICFTFVQKWLSQNQYVFFLCGTLFFYVLRLVFMYFFDTDDLHNRLPHLMIYIFFLGCLAAVSRTVVEKLVTTSVLAIISTEYLLNSFGDQHTFLFLALLSIIWVPIVPLEKYTGIILSKLAMGSLFIYLTHFQARSLLEKLIVNPPPLFSVVFALLIGIWISVIWKKRVSISSSTCEFVKQKFYRWHTQRRD